MADLPLVSIVIPTYNSGKTLDKCLASIKSQTYPRKKIEVLIVDGGSTDDTLKIAHKYKFKVVENPKTDILEAEKLGYIKARGKYLIGLAPDEVLENSSSVELKQKILSENINIKAVLLSGYKTPKNCHPINNYLNEFGDPFSFFLYRESKGEGYLIKDIDKRYKKIHSYRKYNIYDFSNHFPVPLIELWAGGCMVDLDYSKMSFPQIKNNPSLIPLISYLLINKGKWIAVTKKDSTMHYSSANIRKYLKKIRSRIEFNIYLTPMGRGGYSGRELFEKPIIRLKKYLFILYSFIFIFPLIDSLYLSLTRRKMIYLIHPLLCIYTSVLIIYYFSLKKLGIQHKIKLYGN